jgi:flagellar hook-basal body complex protein FliE
MRVETLVPDAPPVLRDDGGADSAGAGGFAQALDAVGQTLTGATRAEDDFAYGRGTLQAAIYERARADVALSVATATASRIAQGVQSILNMQV